MIKAHTVVIGGGVIGLAIARRLALAGRETLLLERHGTLGEETSSRNSEVIHAGIYFPSHMLKTKLCVAGRPLLYDYLRKRRVPHRQCGKLVVATSDADLATLKTIKEKAEANGVHDLEEWTTAQAQAREPNVACLGALFSPSTGIVDSHALMQAYAADLTDAGGLIALRTVVSQVCGRADGGFVISSSQGEIEAEAVVNAAGHGALALAAAMPGLYDPQLAPQALLVKGSYFMHRGRPPFTGLVYPVPNTLSLGVHVTVDVGGAVRYGPDQEPLPAGEAATMSSYRVDPKRADAFYAAVRRYYPALRDGDILPGYAGIRPKLVGQTDFVIQGSQAHGVRSLVQLFGMDSPGLTSSLAIAAHVERALEVM
eukprot:c21793_g1_i1.p1 GENE.c21793_g1_i1~~c21793_g1_i1.p1  ORF type:complete len:384 (+),score=51.21 c21793_g1_i1:43-1152(+)